MSAVQTKKVATRKMGKRTYTLKELAKRDFSVMPKESSEEHAPVFNLVTIQEDLLGNDRNQISTIDIPTIQEEERPENKKGNSQENLALAIDLINSLIKKEISKTAKTLDLEEAELQAWIDLQVRAPKQTLLALLRITRENNLDPLKEEVALALYDDNRWQAYITVEGYSKILNRHPAFDGIAFIQSPESTNGVPIWMECSIFRKDRIMPIVVREYFEEVKGEKAIWQKMPRRMLRHRVMQQCTRLAIM
jgi:hypothetical protein